MSIDKVKKIIKDNGVKFADLRFADMSGREQHLSIPASTLDDSVFEDGKMFDGSSIAGWKGINESDMVLLPDASTVFVDPFAEESTLVLRCDVLEPSTMQPYGRCPRGIAKRAEAYLKASGVGDTAFFGPEPEFFIFDSVRSSVSINGNFYEIESEQGAWNSGKSYEHGNTGHRPGVKGGYFPTGPVDAFQDIRSAMCLTLEALGIPVEVHHSEVATGGQSEIGTRFNTLVKKADELLTLKYVVKNIAHQHGHTATFMPKPLVGDNGSGMHVHQSLAKDGKNLFAGDGYGGLSDIALYYIGGIIKHAKAINAFTNPSTNSYKRLVPGYEAPVLLAYSARNRSASCRIPHVSSPKAKRIEIRFPDPAANPYLAFTAMLMAGLDGIQNKIDPGPAMDKNLYDLPPAELAKIPTVCGSLREALDSLDKDREFLKKGGVMNDDMIDAYIALRMEENMRYEMTPHPVEYDMYYSV